MTNTIKLKNKISSLPVTPGVYIFKDAANKIIYIGKAKSLKKRVQSYFSRSLDTKTQTLIEKIADIEYKPASSESQAQILEASLIKENLPQYNISSKDDKSFPWIKITSEDYPIVSITRRKKQNKDGRSLYFGPYTNVKLLRQAFKIIRKIFGFRSCKNLPKQPCLYYRLKLCPAPCIRNIHRSEYKKTIQNISLFLEFKHDELLNKLSNDMRELAKERKFEEAAIIRDQINALGAIAQSNDFTANNELEDLKKLTGLNVLPLRIEPIDKSNISGSEDTGSMVNFYHGKDDKNNYRRFRIKTVSGINDYAMLQEVVRRRYSRLIAENLPLPDLILIDGGKQHLSTAQKVIDALGKNIPLVSIAKDRENIYLRDKDYPIKLKSDTPALNLIRRIRDEAHRFAISYHHLLRKKKLIGKQ